MTGALRRGRSDQDTGEKAMWWQRQRMDWCYHSKEAPRAGWGRKDAFLVPLAGSVALLIPPFRTSGLQNGKKIHFCCFLSYPVCGPLLQQSQETNHQPWPQIFAWNQDKSQGVGVGSRMQRRGGQGTGNSWANAMVFLPCLPNRLLLWHETKINQRN